MIGIVVKPDFQLDKHPCNWVCTRGDLQPPTDCVLLTGFWDDTGHLHDDCIWRD